MAPSTGDMQIDPVQLSKATGLLKEVTVTAQRPMVEQSDDKIVFNVEDDPTNKTETAIDILRKTPFVIGGWRGQYQSERKIKFQSAAQQPGNLHVRPQH